MKKETTKLQEALAKIFSDLRCLKWYFLSLSMPLKCKNYLGKYDTDKFPGRINFKQLKRDREKVKQDFRPGVCPYQIFSKDKLPFPKGGGTLK